MVFIDTWGDKEEMKGVEIERLAEERVKERIRTG